MQKPQARTAPRKSTAVVPCGVAEADWRWEAADGAAPPRGPFTSFVVVLGKMLQVDGSPEPMLVDRVGGACALWRALPPGAALLLTGGCVQQALQSEAECMHRLAARLWGVPADHILRDNAALNTTQNAENALAFVRRHAAEAPARLPVWVVTSNFHLPRARLYFHTVFDRAGADAARFDLRFFATPFAGETLKAEYKTEDTILAKRGSLPLAGPHEIIRLIGPEAAHTVSPVAVAGVTLVLTAPDPESVAAAVAAAPAAAKVVALSELAAPPPGPDEVRHARVDASQLGGVPADAPLAARVAALYARLETLGTVNVNNVLVCAPPPVLEALAGGRPLQPGECRPVFWRRNGPLAPPAR